MQNPLLMAILLACGLLAIGLMLRSRVAMLRMLYVPASVVAGLLGFVLVQSGLHLPVAVEQTRTIAAEWSTWPGVLIAVVFAGLLLERPADRTLEQSIGGGTRSAILAWIIILGQIVIGLIVYLLLVRAAAPGVPASFGQLLEVSWAGGFGSAAAMARVYAELGFPQGGDLAFFLATVGLLWGVLSGLVMVNLAIRRGWTQGQLIDATLQTAPGTWPIQQPLPAAYAKIRPEVMDPLALQVVILTAAFAAGFVLQKSFIVLVRVILENLSPEYSVRAIGFLSNIPLFLFTLLGGWILRVSMRLVRIDHLIDTPSIQRLVGVAMEFLIVAAISTMRIEAIRTFKAPIIVMIALAAAWCAFCLLVLARRLLPATHWFELGLLNYGFSTANTPQGMMLLRIVDPDLKSGAAEDYAIAAPLSAPFVGGGVMTIIVLPLILQRVPAIWVILALLAAIAGLYALGRRLAR